MQKQIEELQEMEKSRCGRIFTHEPKTTPQEQVPRREEEKV